MHTAESCRSALTTSRFDNGETLGSLLNNLPLLRPLLDRGGFKKLTAISPLLRLYVKQQTTSLALRKPAVHFHDFCRFVRGGWTQLRALDLGDFDMSPAAAELLVKAPLSHT